MKGELKTESDVDSTVMRQRSSNRNGSTNSSTSIIIDEGESRMSSDRTLLPLKKRKNPLVLCIKKFLSFAWLGFGLYGISMMTGGLNINLLVYKQDRRDHHLDSQDLRKNLMDADQSVNLEAKIDQVMIEKASDDDRDDDSVIEVPSFNKQESSRTTTGTLLRKQQPGREPHMKERPTGDERRDTSRQQQESSTKNRAKVSEPRKGKASETKKTIKDSITTPFTGIPNVLLVGAQKSGTTALASWIFKHADVCKPISVANGESIKEVHFFDLEEDMYSQGVDLYKKHFDHCEKENANLILDATPDYLRHADHVFQTYDQLDATSSVKIIMILREPVDREYSWYHHMADEISRSAEPRPYTQTILDDKHNMQRFEKYVSNTVLPDLESSYGLYSKWLRQWMKYFDRKQILVLSYDELSNNQKSIMHRLQQFLNLPEGPKAAPQEIVKLNERAKSRTEHTPSCAAHAKLARAFDPYNRELYKLLEENPGPEAEQRPFPEFKFAHCRQSAEKVEVARREEEETRRGTESYDQTTKSKEKIHGGEDDWKANAAVAGPTTVFFATHHKTGTDISRSVASLLQEQGMVSYSPEWLNENDLFKDGKGEQIKCTGSTTKPEIRSYNQWPKWMIDMMWSKCVGNWWESWPSAGSTTNVLFETCLASEAESLKKQLKWASCDNDHLVVHFVRNPVDLILSSYRYTKLGREDWMHEKVSSHPKFKAEYCGEYNCKGMTIQEAIRDLPMDVGIKLEMHLVSMEIVKQMMVASAFAKLDPEHHITVSLSDIMESSESFDKTWTKILQGVFPTQKSDSIHKLVGMLKKFDMNADPDNFAGRSHSTVGRTSKVETEKHTNAVLSDVNVKFMLKDPLVKTFM